jgi:lipopolysaccharide transport system ATP-binding protein
MQPIISVRGLSKRYKLGVFNAKTLREEAEAFLARFSRKKGEGIREKAERSGSSLSSLRSPSSAPADEFWALRDVSFDVQPGEVIGVIGRNGAGKSTLLKILSRITEPTSGEARIRGRVASLLEVGTGFHPELTGRENVFLNGAILGMTKQEIRNKFDEIVAFAEIEKFIDTPVKRYSSGMYVRLAFAVAAHLEPEVLIVDEVLAVGDASFQKKCLGKMKEVSGQDGRTVLFVSHNMTAVQSLCSRGILMKNGQTAFIGDTEECVRQYLTAGGQIPTEAKWDDVEKAPGNEKVRILGIRAVSKRNDGQDGSLFDMGTPIDIEIEARALKICAFHTTLHFVREDGTVAFTSGGLPPRDAQGNAAAGEYRLVCHVPANLLNEGGYSIRLLSVEDGSRVTVNLEDVIGFDVKDLSPRSVGSWHGREPGPVRPKLAWTVNNRQ